MNYEIHHGDCIATMRAMPENSVDSIVTDPPYELGFMGKKWDATGIANSVAMWAEALRVLKPGGHLLAFSGSRTYHRMTCAIEDAGFDVRDQIMWVYGSGFPKSLDVSKAIDKAAGAERTVVGSVDPRGRFDGSNRSASTSGADSQCVGGVSTISVTIPATEAAQQWQGWGTALKPAHEPICVARKPLIGTVAENVLRWGTGALNIDDCRVATADKLGGGNTSADVDRTGKHEGWQRPWMADADAAKAAAERSSASVARSEELGRWPANLIHDGSDEVLAGFPETGKSTGGGAKNGDKFGGGYEPSGAPLGFGDAGSAARFFYCAKTCKKDRGEGNIHPTVKPTDLMAYLCRLVTPPGGVVLDPFMGSGSTGKAAMREGFRFIGIDMTAEYIPIATARIQRALDQMRPSPAPLRTGQLDLLDALA